MTSVYQGKRVRPKPLNIKPFGLPKRRLIRKFGMRNYSIEFEGGPLDGERVKMHHPCGTLEIELRGETGHYSPGGRWMPSQLSLSL